MVDPRLLLLSSSTLYGSGYLDDAEAEIRATFAGIGRVLFVPHALFDHGDYVRRTRRRFAAMGMEIDSLDEVADGRRAVRKAEAIFVGGGNTFRLLHALQARDLLGPIRERIGAGAPYLGSSAGAIVAGPTLKTTKDMPIVEPDSFRALGLTPFQVSPHDLDPDPASRHMGETQEQRILQFHEENVAPVVGLREGGMLQIEGEQVLLKGAAGARIFRRGREPVEAAPVCRLEELLAPEDAA